MSLETYRQSIREGKRDAIVAAAQRVFLDRGYQGAAMAGIAKAADVSTATLYKHYANKETPTAGRRPQADLRELCGTAA